MFCLIRFSSHESSKYSILPSDNVDSFLTASPALATSNERGDGKRTTSIYPEYDGKRTTSNERGDGKRTTSNERGDGKRTDDATLCEGSVNQGWSALRGMLPVERRGMLPNAPSNRD